MLKAGDIFKSALPEDAGMNSPALRRLISLLNDSCSNHTEFGPAFPHVRCMVLKGGKLVFDEISSAASNSFERPDDDSLYRFYSLTKVFTSVAIVQCFERGLLNLDDPAEKFIPCFRRTQVYVSTTEKTPAPPHLSVMGVSFIPTALETAPQERPITLRHLLTHTAGFGYGGLGLSSGVYDDVDLWCMLRGYPTLTSGAAGFEDGADLRYQSLAGICDLIASMPLKFQPGTKFEYGIGHTILGRVVEVVTGLNFGIFVNQNILGPLNMESTSFGVHFGTHYPKLLRLYTYGPTGVAWDLKGPSQGRPAYRAVAPLVEASGCMDPCLFPHFGEAVGSEKGPCFGDSGLAGTAPDLLKFAFAIANGGVGVNGGCILGARTLNLMFQNHLPGGASLHDMENDVNSRNCKDFSGKHRTEGLGFGLGGAVSLGNRHQVRNTHKLCIQTNLDADGIPFVDFKNVLLCILSFPSSQPHFQVEDGVLAMGPGSYTWAGIAGTDMIIDPSNGLAIVFLTQVLWTCHNDDVNGMLGCGRYARLIYAALQ